MIEELKNELRAAIQSGQQKNVTHIRGKLIAAYKKKIKELEEKESLTDEEQIKLNTLKEELIKEVSEHKIQLDARYSNEVIREETSLTKITEVPKNVGIAIEKVKACIEDLKLAKTNKQKLFKSLELVKSLGMVIGAPAIYAGKITLKAWYIPVIILSILKITDIEWLNTLAEKTNLPKGLFGTLEDIRNAPVIKPIYEGFDEITDKGIDFLRDTIGRKLGFDYDTPLEDLDITPALTR